MDSVLKLLRNRKLNYSASSLSESSTTNNKYNVFVDDKSFFRSTNDVSNQWWQVSFQIPVTIDSYIIKSSCSWYGRLISWIINASMNNETWETINAVNGADPCNSNGIHSIKLTKNSTLLHFRIIEKKNGCGSSCSNNYLLFSFFDAFGRIANVGNQCTCKRRCSRSINIAFVFIFSLVNSYS